MSGTLPQSYPRRVESLPVANYVAAGTWHSAAIDEHGSVYVWGDGRKARSSMCRPIPVPVPDPSQCGGRSQGQLGTGKMDREMLPVKVAEPIRNARIKQVACGGGVTAFLTREGRVYQAGR